MGKKQERLNQLIIMLKKHPKSTVKNLAEHFAVSEMTIRRDLAYLETASLISTTPQVSPLAFAAPRNSHETPDSTSAFIPIGKLAASLIEDNDIIIADSGPAVSYMCSVLPPEKQVTILCYSYDILSTIHGLPNVTVLLAGGHSHPGSNVFDSVEGMEFIRNHRASKVFLTGEGLHPTLGITYSHNYMAELRRTACETAKSRILLADSTCFDQIYPYYFLGLTGVDILITDQMPSDTWQRVLAEHSIYLMTP